MSKKCDVENPDPSKYVMRRRNGQWVPVDKQVLAWRKFRKKPYKRQSKKNPGGRPKFDPTKINFFE